MRASYRHVKAYGVMPAPIAHSRVSKWVGLITAQEYLARNGLGNRPIEDIPNANGGKPKLRR